MASPPHAQTPDRATLVAFATAVVIGGANFVAVKFSNEELEPLFGATLRFAAASLVFFGIMAIQRMPFPDRRGTLGAALYGLLGFGFAYGLLYFALVGLAAGTASVLVASVPLMTLILAVAHGQERFSLRGVVGGLLAIVGIAILSASSLGGDLRPIYVVAALVGVIAIAESSVLVKGFPRAHPVTTNAIGMVTGTIFLAPMSLILGESWTVPEETQTWVVLAWLVLAGSVGLFVLFLFVIARWTASASVYALTLMPVVAVALGALLADEPVTIELVVGGLIVLAGVYVGALSRPRAPAAQLPEAAPAVTTESTP